MTFLNNNSKVIIMKKKLNFLNICIVVIGITMFSTILISGILEYRKNGSILSLMVMFIMSIYGLFLSVLPNVKQSE